MVDAGVLVLGAGGHARVLAALLTTTSHRVLGVLDRHPLREGERIGRLAGLGTYDALDGFHATGVRHVVLALGDNAQRAAMYEKVRGMGFQVLGLRHPSVIVHPGAEVADDAVLCAGAVIGAEARIGDNVLVNTAAVVEHECVVEAHAHISSRAVLAGRVRVGRGTFIGAGSSVRDQIRIGAGVVVGVGAAVVSDLPDLVVAVGVPARVRSDLKSSWTLGT